jgi:phospholipase C
MNARRRRGQWPKISAVLLTVALSQLGSGALGHAASDLDQAVDSLATTTPIKHVIIIVGENRSFDHLFATYTPVNANESVMNLLSQGIVNANGTPGPHFALGQQYKIVSPPNGGKFFISADLAQKQLYSFLPPPDVAGSPKVAPHLGRTDPGLGPPSAPAQLLLGTGGTGLTFSSGPDTRIAGVNTLAPGPFQMTGPTMAYDAYTSDTIHQFFQMYQQVDCAIDAEHVSPGNPTGCLHDLQSAITTTYSTPPTGTPTDTGQTMAFFNMQNGDVPLFRQLADHYTMSDNYHQPVLGGTGPDSVPLGFADQVFYSDGAGHAITPPANRIYNPDPQPGTLNLYTARQQWFNCNDQTQPGIAAITAYLSALPYHVNPNCDPGAYYNAVNVNPAYNPNGTLGPSTNIPPVTMRSIGDVLTASNIPWKYYGNGYNPGAGGYCNICNPFEYQLNYPAMRADHMRDITDLFADLTNGTLPAVSYVKPDGWLDGHPASSKFNLFEAFVENILELAQSNPEQWAETAVFVTVDEGGGYYDSGFIQPVDFFGTGPRIPMIAVSPFSTGGHISHVYNEHSSFVKFVERNWMLHTTLTGRSRDNLANPQQDAVNPYVPKNMPAIGDLFDLFDFGRLSSGNACNGFFSGAFHGNVTVSDGQSCTIVNGTVDGSVQVKGGHLVLSGTTVRGNVEIHNGGTFSIDPMTTIVGNLEIHNLPASSAGNELCGVSVQQNLEVHNNDSAIQIGSSSPVCANTIGGDLDVHNNDGATAIVDNTVGGNLQCHSNSSIVGGGNTASRKQGQCSSF